jgi:hypothetical protein
MSLVGRRVQVQGSGDEVQVTARTVDDQEIDCLLEPGACRVDSGQTEFEPISAMLNRNSQLGLSNLRQRRTGDLAHGDSHVPQLASPSSSQSVSTVDARIEASVLHSFGLSRETSGTALSMLLHERLPLEHGCCAYLDCYRFGGGGARDCIDCMAGPDATSRESYSPDDP